MKSRKIHPAHVSHMKLLSGTAINILSWNASFVIVMTIMYTVHTLSK